MTIEIDEDKLQKIGDDLDGLWYILESLFTEKNFLKGIPPESIPNIGKLLLDILEKNQKIIAEIQKGGEKSVQD